MHSILSPEISTLLTLLLYSVAGVLGMIGMICRSIRVRRLAAVSAVAGIVFQTIILFTGFHAQTEGGLSVGAYLQMLAWFLVLCGIGLWIFMKQETPVIFASIFSLLLYGLSAPTLAIIVRVPDTFKTSFYALHVGPFFLSLALITLAFAAGVIFLYLDYRIKAKLPLPHFIQDMPALSILDKINALSTLAGFPLYTIGLVCGFFYAAPVFGGTVTGDPKQIVTLFTWALYAILFHNRLARGWRGRKPAKMMILIFTLSALSFIVVNLFMNSHHAFIRN